MITKRTTIEIPRDLWAYYKIEAIKQEKPMVVLMIEALEQQKRRN